MLSVFNHELIQTPKISIIKMKNKISIAFCMLLATIVIISCEKEGSNKTNISSTGSKESHNMGRNCMDCHKSGGEGEGWFKVAGTLYDSSLTKTHSNGFIELYTQPDGNGSLVKRVAVDGLGNFYTTENVDFGNGLYPVAISSSGKRKFMQSTTNTGVLQ
jgi:hypothetical protein